MLYINGKVMENIIRTCFVIGLISLGGGLHAQDGAGQFLGSPVSVREIGLPKEIPARMDFHVVVNAPYSVQIQGRLREEDPSSKEPAPHWQGLEADMVRTFVRWMQRDKQIRLDFDPIFHRDTASLRAAMLADPSQSAGVLVGDEGLEPLKDSAWLPSLPWLRSGVVLLAPFSDRTAWGNWKAMTQGLDDRNLVLHQSPMTAAWEKEWNKMISSRCRTDRVSDESMLWKALGKKSGITYAIMDAGTASAFLRQGDFSGWRVRIPGGSSPSVRYLVFPRGSLLRMYWEEFLFSGWGWLNSQEFQALMDKHLHAGAHSVIKPYPGQ